MTLRGRIVMQVLSMLFGGRNQPFHRVEFAPDLFGQFLRLAVECAQAQEACRELVDVFEPGFQITFV